MYNAAAKRLGILRHVSGKVLRKTLEHLYKVLQNKLGWPSLSVRKQYLSCVMCQQYISSKLSSISKRTGTQFNYTKASTCIMQYTR